MPLVILWRKLAVQKWSVLLGNIETVLVTSRQHRIYLLWREFSSLCLSTERSGEIIGLWMQLPLAISSTVCRYDSLYDNHRLTSSIPISNFYIPDVDVFHHYTSPFRLSGFSKLKPSVSASTFCIWIYTCGCNSFLGRHITFVYGYILLVIIAFVQ